ncbi:phage tail protein [Campylobacter concisus]|uniref:phage tail protein n=1 Tax=Campylobacter concisus TaxID=199 RepID=UPI0039B75185
MPIGAYLSYPSQKTIPAGFLIADGRSLKKAEYTELFDVLGYVYGGSGENFNLPNFADGKFMRSIGGNAAGLGVVQQDAFQGHFHKWKDSTTEVGWTYNFTGNTSNKPGTRDNISSIAEPKSDGVNGEPRTANETRPYNMAVVVIIKAKNVNTPTAGQIDKTILATEAKLGVVKLKNSITAKQEDAAITEKAVSDAIEANKSIGIGQTYQDVWAQRELNTYYLNTTSRPIMVGVDFEPTLVDTPISVVIDDQIVRTAGIDSRIHVGFSFVVPAGSKYKIATLLNTSLKKINLVVDVTNKKYNTWNELK